MFKQRAGVDIVHVPYKGSALLLPDLIEGRVSMALDSMPAHLPHIKTGRLRALAVASPQRSAQLPDVPTISEAGLPGFQSNTDYALYAPAGTPSEVVQLLNTEVGRILNGPDARKRADESGTAVLTMSPQELAQFTKSELERWGRVISSAKITVE